MRIKRYPSGTFDRIEPLHLQDSRIGLSTGRLIMLYGLAFEREFTL